MDIAELHKLRREWVEINRKNGFEEGIKRLLTDLYPENAHFIYELLQNAEDPGASTARFYLNDTDFQFEHDGKRLFSLCDVGSITSIGASTKRDDPTKIGKFGVGFKAVFAYTNTPRIHSGDFHFRIRDLVVPEVEDGRPESAGVKFTRFIFPFDNPRKPLSKAREEIQRGLLDLTDNTLLFLQNIREIEYCLPDGTVGSLRRIDHADGHVEIRALHPGMDETVSHWLRFEKNVEVEEDGLRKQCRIAVAFRLEKENDKKNGPEWKIVPLERGEVSIYFPAEKEVSNLRFHMHAPFASTVARDSIRDCPGNRQLRDAMGVLIVEALESIRDRGLLTVAFLAVLPNEVDNLAGSSPFYEPIRKAIVRAFQSKPLTPTRSGTFAPSKRLCRGPSRIADVLGDEGLAMLVDSQASIWAANPSQQGQRDDRFLDSLGITSWGWFDLAEDLSNFCLIHRNKLEAWIAAKDDGWLFRFYALLGEAISNQGEHVRTGAARIIRVISGGEQKHVVPAEAFFTPESEIVPPDDLAYVKPEVYALSRSEVQKKYASEFLLDVGVRRYDAEVAIALLLEGYLHQPSAKTVDYSHFRDVAQFVAFWKKNRDSIGMFRTHRFLLGVAKNGEKRWCFPSGLCIDAPYRVTGLTEVTDVLGKHVLCSEYETRLPKKLQNDFIDFICALGVVDGIQIVRGSAWGNPDRSLFQYVNGRTTHTGISEDFEIPNLDKLIAKRSLLVSRMIWFALIGAEQRVAFARYRPNREYPTKQVNSKLVHALRASAWIPNKDGVFCKPQDMTRDDLRSDFPYDDRNELLTAIAFAENARKKNAEYLVRAKKREELGFSSDEELEVAQQLVKTFTPQEIRDLLNERAYHAADVQPFPERPVRNAELRRERVKTQANETPLKQTQVKLRSLPVDQEAAVAAAKQYLKDQYTNDNGVMVCQICRKPMIFRLPSGEYYFEAVELFEGQEKRFRETYIALCPNDAAKFKYANSQKKQMKEVIESAKDHEIEITLAESTHHIKFTETHMLDVLSCLSVGQETPEEERST